MSEETARMIHASWYNTKTKLNKEQRNKNYFVNLENSKQNRKMNKKTKNFYITFMAEKITYPCLAYIKKSQTAQIFKTKTFCKKISNIVKTTFKKKNFH